MHLWICSHNSFTAATFPIQSILYYVPWTCITCCYCLCHSFRLQIHIYIYMYKKTYNKQFAMMINGNKSISILCSMYVQIWILCDWWMKSCIDLELFSYIKVMYVSYPNLYKTCDCFIKNSTNSVISSDSKNIIIYYTSHPQMKSNNNM